MEKYLVYLVSKTPGVQTLGVVRESDTMMHVHFLTRSSCFPGAYKVDGEGSMHKVSFTVEKYEPAFTEKEAIEIEIEFHEAKTKMSRLMADDD